MKAVCFITCTSVANKNTSFILFQASYCVFTVPMPAILLLVREYGVSEAIPVALDIPNSKKHYDCLIFFVISNTDGLVFAKSTPVQNYI